MNTSFDTLAVLGWLSAYIVALLAAFDVLTWLNLVYWLSYVKLFVTFVKYIPQVKLGKKNILLMEILIFKIFKAWMNFRRKSTVGWHIGNVLLDLTGGIFSFLQMFIDAINEGKNTIYLLV